MRFCCLLFAFAAATSAFAEDAAQVLAQAANAKVVFHKPAPGIAGPDAKAVFFVTDSGTPSDRRPVDVHGMIALPKAQPVFLSTYPYEGGRAEIEDAFVADYLGQKILFVIVRWRVLHSGLGIDGHTYKVYVYADKAAKGKDGALVLPQNDSLEKALAGGEGFDGIGEEGKSDFPYKSAQSILKKISSSPGGFTPEACLQKVIKSHRAKALELGCAVDFVNGGGLEAALITPMNVTVYNDLGFYLGEGAWYKESVRVLEKVVAAVPRRTVGYLNLADAYWGLADTAEARQAYKKYCDLMKAGGKASRIPKRVLERFSKE